MTEQELDAISSFFGETDNVIKDILLNELQRKFKEVISTLAPREQYVIEERYFNHKSLVEVANALNVTRQRINQIEHKALKKLNNRKEVKKLKAFLVH